MIPSRLVTCCLALLSPPSGARGMTAPQPSSPKRTTPRKLRLIEATADETIGNISGNDSTGRRIWDAGRALSRLLPNMSGSLRGKKVLELGSGTGIVGLTAAIEGATVCLTDGASGALPNIEANIGANGLGHLADVRCLQWGNGEQIAAVSALGPFDVILGSDLLYSPESFPELVDTLAALCTAERTEVLLAYPARFTESIFFEQMDVLFDEVERDEIEPAVYLTRLVMRKK